MGHESRLNIPCRNCLGCNAATARDWSVRCFHEAQLHTTNWRDEDTQIVTQIPNSSVVTLTYDEEHLPIDGLLHHDDFQRFAKRMRFRRSTTGNPKPIRYFMAGEYGGRTARPHFHAIIFGEAFDDRYSEQSRDGQVNQMSYELDKLWSQPASKNAPSTKIGRATVDDFTFAGAAYVAGYVAKKSNTNGPAGPMTEQIDADGVVTYVCDQPEYRRMSTRPDGLGAKWLLKPENLVKVYENDCINISAWTFHPPRYYDTLLERHRPDLIGEVKAKRQSGMGKSAEQWSPDRCAAAERIAIESLQQRRDLL